ncbi:hypothetical protein B0H19DRAFT_1380681 [Mycena capillaripes]|nr:hypothetical protein B0H19DRAFT_1380681 [Mycena capillaripes]
MLSIVTYGVQLTDSRGDHAAARQTLQCGTRPNHDTVQLSGEVRFWNMATGETRTVNVLWDDYAGGSHNASVDFLGMSTAAGRHSAAWYGFNASGSGILPIDSKTGITSMRFLVDGTLEDQGGLGFAIQDGFMLSATSCITAVNATTNLPSAGRLDVAVRNGVSPTRVYLEYMTRESVQRPTVVEIDILLPAQPVVANSAYSLWSMDITAAVATFNIGAEINRIKYSRNVVNLFFTLPLCAT